MTRITIWNEFRHEKTNATVREIYPNGIHEAIASHLRKNRELEVKTATLNEREHGLSNAVVDDTDVLVWWGHMAHDDVADAVVQRCHDRIVKHGMGFVALHSGHFSKLFKKLMGTTCDLKWREVGEREILWVTQPGHPIVAGIEDHFVLHREEMYGEYFDVPPPDETVMISSFAGGEVFRSLCTWQRGAGRIAYFRPGHETFPTYHDANVLQVIENAARWAAPTRAAGKPSFGNRPLDWTRSI